MTGLVGAMESARHRDHWCTPSHAPNLNLSLDLDVSVSDSAIGSLLDHAGPIKELEASVATARGADRAFLSVTGSTGGNQVAMRAIARSSPHAGILASPGCHHSVIQAAMLYGVRARFLSARVLPDYDAILPPTPAEVERGLRANPDVNAVVITSPTYEGLVADIPAIADIVHQYRLPLIVDSAWGSHFGFHSKLPMPAATQGADLVVESLHKCGGAAQGAGVLLLSGGLVDPAVVDAAYRELTTTSPSFLILASIEQAVRALNEGGESLLSRPIELASQVANGLAELGLPILKHEQWGDRTKVTIGGVHGFALGEALARRQIIAEKCSNHTTLFLATMQLPAAAVGRLLTAVEEVLPAVRIPATDNRSSIFDALAVPPIVEAHEVARGLPVRRVPRRDAIGLVAAEIVELYPPGIPVLLPGWLITGSAISSLEKAAAAGGRIAASDPSLQTVAVVDASAQIHAA